MCQLGAVVVSDERVFYQDHVRSHEKLLTLAAKAHPDELFVEAEYNFRERQWGYGSEDLVFASLTTHQVRHLRAFAAENWNDTEALMRFCEHAGAPEDTLLSGSAEHDFNAALPPLESAYDVATRASRVVFHAALGAADGLVGVAYHTARDAAQKTHTEALHAADVAYNEACYPVWLHLFSEPTNRIPAWQ